MGGGAEHADCTSGWKSPGGAAAEGREDIVLNIKCFKVAEQRRKIMVARFEIHTCSITPVPNSEGDA